MNQPIICLSTRFRSFRWIEASSGLDRFSVVNRHMYNSGGLLDLEIQNRNCETLNPALFFRERGDDGVLLLPETQNPGYGNPVPCSVLQGQEPFRSLEPRTLNLETMSPAMLFKVTMDNFKSACDSCALLLPDTPNCEPGSSKPCFVLQGQEVTMDNYKGACDSGHAFPLPRLAGFSDDNGTPDPSTSIGFGKQQQQHAQQQAQGGGFTPSPANFSTSESVNAGGFTMQGLGFRFRGLVQESAAGASCPRQPTS